MKLSNFKLVDEKLNKDQFDQLVYGFNQTAREYPDETIHGLYKKMALENPDAIAVVFNNEQLTYKELEEQSDQLAALLMSKGIHEEQIIGILMNRSVQMIIALLGTLKAGAAYLPLTPDQPLERMKVMLNDCKTSFLISEKQHIKTINTLQWACPQLQAYLCIDSNDVLSEEEPRNEFMDKELWDYVGEKATDDISAGGWVNSYTGEDMSRKVMDEYADNVFKKLSPLVGKESKVLEIACSSGITLFRIAPLVKEYVGIDLSSEILAKTQQAVTARGLDNIRLQCLPASDIEQLGEKDFDVIILNSVIQCFNGHNYLRSILKKAIGLLKDNGVIFAGDIMDQDKKEELIRSTLEFKQANAGKGYNTKTEWNEELFLPRKFFEDLRFDFPEIEEIKNLDKIYTEESELTRFRYDCIIRVNKRSLHAPGGQRNKYQFDCRDLVPVVAFQPGDLPGNAGNIAYVMYTSGSTGKPKGVLVEHRSVVRLVTGPDYLDISKNDRFSQSISFAFDPSIFEIWGALLNGAGLYIAEKGITLSPTAYESFLKANKISICTLPAALFNAMVDHDPAVFSEVQTLIIGGEVLSTAHVNQLRKAHPQVKIINAYGPTENTAFSTCFTIDKDYTTAIPIGKPISNSQCYVLDKNNNPQPVGIPGELFVAGDGLARGYLNDEALTDEKFIPNPFIPGKRMYRTGDQAKWLPDGNLEFLGRNDHQVKISGYRVELGEIESQLRTVPGVSEVVVVDKNQASGEKYLVAYLTLHNDIPAEQIKSSLAMKLPGYMVPAHFMVLDKLPLNENGKVDRKALPHPQADVAEHFTPPSTPMEKILASIWCELLETTTVGIYDSFFDLGGNSLKVTRMVSRLYKETGLKLDLRSVFSRPFISDLARSLESTGHFLYQPIPKVPEQPSYEVSHAQKRLWTLSQLVESSRSYNMAGAYLLRGTLNKTAFEQAYHDLIERHESLRTVFTETGDTIRQCIMPVTSNRLAMEYLDLSEQADAGVLVQEMVNEAVSYVFDLNKGPLIRAKLISSAPDEYALLFSMHHIISDGWSMEVLVKDMLALYDIRRGNGYRQLKPLTVQYKDYAAWQNQLAVNDLAEQKHYWLTQLKDLQPLQLPLDKPRPAIQSFNGNRVHFEIEGSLFNAIQAQCRRQDVTLFMTALTAVNVLFYRYTSQCDILIGSPVAGREHPDLEDQIGFYVNALALRTKLNAGDTFTSILGKVKEVALQAYANQAYPFDQIVDELAIERDLGQSALFNVMVALNSDTMYHEWTQGLEGVTVTSLEQDKVYSMFDMSIRFMEGPSGLTGHIEYNTDLFEESTITRMKTHLLGILHEMVKNPGGSISNAAYLGPAEEKQLLSEFNNTDLPIESNKTLIDLFDQQCSRIPEQVAVVYEQNSLTYLELQQKSELLATQLAEIGVSAGDRIALCMERSADMITAIMGILRAGAAYVPIDPAWPEERKQYILKDAGIKVMITDNLSVHHCEDEGRSNLPCPEELLLPHSRDRNDALHEAYVIYTSGTTGKPKGVSISHHAVINLVAGLEKDIYSGHKGHLRVALVAPCVFDASVQQIFAVLLLGHSLYIVPDEIKQEGESLVAYCSNNRIDISDGAPVHLQLLSEALAGVKTPLPVRHFIIGGDVLPKKLVKDFYSHLTDNPVLPLISNVYGPTECCVDVTCYTIQPGLVDDLDTIPIGKPMANRKAYILDDNLQLMPVGTWGNLYIGGTGLSQGYINLPELTGESFISSPFKECQVLYKTGDICRWTKEGNLLFQGRNDHQVKIRGYRIELYEIEKQMLAHKAVKEAIVLATEDEEENKYLEAFFTSTGHLNSGALADHLRKFLPDYMIPSQFTRLEKFPLTHSGKIDRKALLYAARNTKPLADGPAGSETETRLLELWRELLKRDRIEVTDSFFEIGGHSIKAVRLIALIHKTFGVKLHLRDIFVNNTVKLQAALIESSAQPHSAIEKIEEQEFYELSHAQKRLWLLQQLDPQSTAYNLPVAVELTGPLNKAAFKRAFGVFISRHESLRTIFTEVQGEPRQKIISPDVSFIRIEEIDLRNDTNREEKARLLAEEEVQRPFDLAAGPLVRLRLVQTADDIHLFLFTMHHIISDGWSSTILLKEITLLYNAFVQQQENPLQPLRIQYRDYASWHNKALQDGTLGSHRQYWLSQFADVPPALELPADFKRPELKTGAGNILLFNIDAETTRMLQDINSQHETTLFMTLLAITKVLLYKYSNQTDITVGSSISGRIHPDLEDQVGFYVNTLPLRSRFDKNHSFEEVLEGVKKHTLEAFEHQVYPFDKIVDDLALKRDLSRSPLFDVMVELHNFAENFSISMDGLVARQYRQENLTSRFDLIFNFHETEKDLVATIEYNTDLFRTETIELMKLRFLKLVSAILAEPHKPVYALDMQTEIEAQAVKKLKTLSDVQELF